MFQFIHAADIHLDSPLRGLAGQDGAAAERIRGATREAFENLVSYAIDERVAFLVIAGDLYDGDWRDYQTGLFFVGQMARLAAADIPVFVLHGNHDAESRITRRLTLPANVQTFDSKRPQTFTLPEHRVALHGQSFAQRDVSDDLSAAYPEPRADHFNVGVLHTALGGTPGHANYAPCSLPALIAKGYDYWALGHVHQHALLHEHPHVVFAGNLQGRYARETGVKGACLITVEDGQLLELRHLPLDVVRWVRLAIDVGACSSMQRVFDEIHRALASAVAEHGADRLLACRLELHGETELHSQLVSAGEPLQAEARAAALTLGEEAAWIEKIKVVTKPLQGAAYLKEREDVLGEMFRSLQLATADPALIQELLDDIGLFVERLPADVRRDAEDPLLRAAIEGDTEGLLALATDDLIARLAGAPD